MTFQIRHTVQLAKIDQIEDNCRQSHAVDRLLVEAQRAPAGTTILINAGRIQPWQYTHRLTELQARHTVLIESEHVDVLHEWSHALRGVELV